MRQCSQTWHKATAVGDTTKAYLNKFLIKCEHFSICCIVHAMSYSNSPQRAEGPKAVSSRSHLEWCLDDTWSSSATTPSLLDRSEPLFQMAPTVFLMRPTSELFVVQDDRFFSKNNQTLRAILDHTNAYQI